MARIAFHLRIQEGQRAKCREEHEDVPERLGAYLDSDADIKTYSLFEKDGHVFGYLELENPEAIREVMEESDAQADWDEVMAGILEDEDDIWMDEVYRMV